MDNTLLELHKEWMERGVMNDFGLCQSIPHKYLSLFERVMSPSYDDVIMIGVKRHSSLYWGSESHDFKIYSYTPLRQTILLLFHEYINS